MNKLKSTKKRVFLSLVGPSGSGKSHPKFDWLKIGAFIQLSTIFFYFYQPYPTLYSQMQGNNLMFVQG